MESPLARAELKLQKESYTAEKRDYVRRVAESLAAALGRENVLYDEYLEADRPGW